MDNNHDDYTQEIQVAKEGARQSALRIDECNEGQIVIERKIIYLGILSAASMGILTSWVWNFFAAISDAPNIFLEFGYIDFYLKILVAVLYVISISMFLSGLSYCVAALYVVTHKSKGIDFSEFRKKTKDLKVPLLETYEMIGITNDKIYAHNEKINARKGGQSRIALDFWIAGVGIFLLIVLLNLFFVILY